MKFGVCCRLDRAQLVKDAGYDYVEEHFAGLNRMTDEEFDAVVLEYKKIGIPVSSTNCFFPFDWKLYEHEKEYYYDYAKRGFERASRLGIKTCVVGSGRPRSVPEGVDRAVTFEKFTAIMAYIADIAKEYGITLVIEPLQPCETNFINTVEEGALVAKATGKDNVKVLVDFFQFYCANEPDDGLIKADGYLYHAHFARPNADRKMPTEEDLPEIKKWISMLKEIGYDNNISVEGFIDFENDLVRTKKILDLFKK